MFTLENGGQIASIVSQNVAILPHSDLILGQKWPEKTTIFHGKSIVQTTVWLYNN